MLHQLPQVISSLDAYMDRSLQRLASPICIFIHSPYSAALLQQYFSANEKCFPLTINQHNLNFSETNKLSFLAAFFLSRFQPTRLKFIFSFFACQKRITYVSFVAYDRYVSIIYQFFPLKKMMQGRLINIILNKKINWNDHFPPDTLV